MSFSSSPRRFRLTLSAAVVLLSLLSGTAHAQKVDKAKLETAARRSGKAAKVLTDLSALPPGETIPRELIERARAIAVFPDSDKMNLLIQKFWKGSGLMSRRVEGGWSTPAFYGFVVSDRGWTRVKSEEPGLIVLFMDDAMVKKLEKGNVKLEGAPGPVGEMTPAQQKEANRVSVLIYTIFEGKVRGVGVEDDLTTQTGIGPDNKLNKAVYGLKSREVLGGQPPVAPASVPPAVAEFQNALAGLSKQQQPQPPQQQQQQPPQQQQ